MEEKSFEFTEASFDKAEEFIASQPIIEANPPIESFQDELAGTEEGNTGFDFSAEGPAPTAEDPKDQKTTEKRDDCTIFLTALYRNCDKGYVEIRTFPDNDIFAQWAKDQHLEAPRFWMSLNHLYTIRSQIPTIQSENQWGIYLGVATREFQKGKKNNIVQIPALWLDVDDMTPDIQADLDGFLQPSIVVQSSTTKKRHHYWILKEPKGKEDIPQVEDLLKRLAQRFDGDLKSTDASRVLRLPESLNFKLDKQGNPRDGTYQRCKLISLNDKEYELDDFDDILPPYEPNGKSQDDHKGKKEDTVHDKESYKSKESEIERLLKGVREGERHGSALTLTGHFLGKGLPESEIAILLETWNQTNQPPMPEVELDRVVSDISKKHREEKKSEKEPEVELTGEDLLNSIPTAADIRAMEIKVEWVVDQLIPQCQYTFLFGKGGLGKSWIMYRMGECVVTGQDFFGLPVKQMPVIYMDYQNYVGTLSERFEVLDANHIRVWHLFSDNKPPKIDSKRWKLVKTLPPSLIIMDTLRSAQSLDTLSTQDMAGIMEQVKELREYGHTPIMIHNTNKNNDMNFTGSQTLFDEADNVLLLQRVKGIGEEAETGVGEDDLGKPLRLGFKDKFRNLTPPPTLHFLFETGKGFVRVDDPDLREMEAMRNALKQSGNVFMQKKDYAKLCDTVLGMSKRTFDRLIKKGMDKYWRMEAGRDGKRPFQNFYPIASGSGKTNNPRKPTEPTESKNPVEDLVPLQNIGKSDNGDSEKSVEEEKQPLMQGKMKEWLEAFKARRDGIRREAEKPEMTI